MRQLLYVSSSVSGSPELDLPAIVRQSCRNNGAAGITGLLWTDGKRFLQVLEGPDEAVEPTYQRIKRDSRHRALVVLSDRSVETREFGDWAMAYRARDERVDLFDQRVMALLAGASENVRGTFTGLIAARRAA